MKFRVFALLTLTIPGLASTAFAAENVAEAEMPVTAAQVEQWLKWLSSAEFSQRREASQRLVDAGAVDEVAKLADSADLETAARCLDVLKRIYLGKNSEAKSAAESAMKRLSESDHRSIASRAAEIIRKPDPNEGRANVFGNVQIQVQVGNVIRARVPAPQVVLREATHEENGKKYRMQELPAELIVEVTEKVTKGNVVQETTTRYSAANIFELRKKHPEAAKIFEKHMRGPAANQANPAPAAKVVENPPAFPLKNGARTRIQMKNINGMREIEVETGEMKLKITDNNGKDIRIEKQETINGTTKNSISQAKDYEQLKQALPEIAKLYDKYARGNGGAVINGNGGIQIEARAEIQGDIQIQAVPAQAIPIRAIPLQAVPLPAVPDAPAEKK